MIDAKDLFHDKDSIVGHVETNSGGLLLTDGGWEDDLPLTTQESLALDLNIDAVKIPVIAVRKNNKRFLILAIDDAVPVNFASAAVEIIDKVEEPKDEEEAAKKEEPDKQ